MKHIEEQMKGLRNFGSIDRDLWEREWVTIGTLLEIVGRDLNAVKSVADVGCGAREMEVGARERGIEYFGFDIDDGNFESDRLPADDSSIDLVIALAIIEHLHNPDNFLRESLRVLRPDGILLVSTPNWHYAARDFFDNPAHVQPYSPTSMEILLTAYGFGSVRTFPGLRAKAQRAYLGQHRFLRAALRPIRGSVKWLPEAISGKATSIFALGARPTEVSDSS